MSKKYGGTGKLKYVNKCMVNNDNLLYFSSGKVECVQMQLRLLCKTLVKKCRTSVSICPAALSHYACVL